MNNLTKKDHRRIQQTYIEALNSPMRTRVAACLDTAGQATLAYNRPRSTIITTTCENETYPSSERPLRNSFSYHAEERVLKHVKSNSILYVVRIDGDGLLRGSFPCDSCWGKVVECGVKRVVFYDGVEFVKIRVKDYQ